MTKSRSTRGVTPVAASYFSLLVCILCSNFFLLSTLLLILWIRPNECSINMTAKRVSITEFINVTNTAYSASCPPPSPPPPPTPPPLSTSSPLHLLHILLPHLLLHLVLQYLKPLIIVHHSFRPNQIILYNLCMTYNIIFYFEMHTCRCTLRAQLSKESWWYSFQPCPSPSYNQVFLLH